MIAQRERKTIGKKIHQLKKVKNKLKRLLNSKIDNKKIVKIGKKKRKLSKMMDIIEHRNPHIGGTHGSSSSLKEHSWQMPPPPPPLPPRIQTPNNNNNNNNNNINNNNHHHHHHDTTLSTTTNQNRDEVDNRGSSNIDHKFEITRRESYRNWPVSFMDPDKLASAGFYYTGIDDRVKCFECGVEMCEWHEGDNPMSDHQYWRPNCRFVRKISCGNVPIGADPTTVPTPLPRSRDVCGPFGEEIRPNPSPDYRTRQTEFTYPSPATLGSLGLIRPKPPSHPEYASYDARLRTFDTWPKSMAQTKEQLANAGFYYTGSGDHTQCHHCGGGLKDWEPKDDPWKQHAKWFKKCYYVLTVKGQAYINSVTGQRVVVPTKEEIMQMNLPSCIHKVEQSASQSTEEMSTEDEAADKNQLQIPSTSSSPSPCSDQQGKDKNADDARIMCKICYNEELGVLFLPCGHVVACGKCAPALVTCPMCREKITATTRVIIP